MNYYLQAVPEKLIVQIDKEFLDTPTQSVGGIYLPADQQVKVMTGVITSMHCNDSNSVFKQGMRIAFGKYSCTELEGEFHGLASLRIEDVLAVVCSE